MPKFAQRIYDMAATAKVVEGLFKSMGAPDLISFSGGAPCAELLPYDALREINNRLMTQDNVGMRMLQYGFPEGELELRQAVAKYLLAPKGIEASADDVIIINGGMESMSMLCQLYINPGDVILVESPTFVQAVEAFEMFQAKCIGVKCDDGGIDLEDLEAKIKEYSPKIVYIIPTFQNPSGRTLSAERRERIAQLASQYDVMVLEDDPYRDLRYSGEHLPPIKIFDKTDNVIMAGSCSKIFSPGSRIGYIYASPEIIAQLYNVKTATNSQTNTPVQLLCAEFFNGGYFDEHLKRCIETYRERRDAMVECVEKYFPEGTKYAYPDGGLFTWVELPGNINTTELLKKAEPYKVAFLPGEKFFVEGSGDGTHCMRLSFGNVNPERIRIGMERLGKLIAENMDA